MDRTKSMDKTKMKWIFAATGILASCGGAYEGGGHGGGDASAGSSGSTGGTGASGTQTSGTAGNSGTTSMVGTGTAAGSGGASRTTGTSSTSNTTAGSGTGGSVGAGGTGGTGGTSPGSDVIGAVINRYLNDGPNGDEVQVAVPRNLTGVPIAAIWQDAGTFVTRAGSGTAIGTFTIPGVPVGEYYLRVGDEYTRTTDRHPEIRKAMLGRSDAVLAPSPTPIVYSVAGLEPWGAEDILELTCVHNGSWDSPSLIGFDSNPPAAGDTMLKGATDDWGLISNYVIDKDRGDVALLTQLSTKTAGAVSYQALTRALRFDQLKQVAGQSMTLTGTLAAVPQNNFHIDFRVSEFDGFRTAVHPMAENVGGGPGIGFATVPGITREGTYGYSVDLMIMGPPTTADVDVNVAFGNPFPAGWGVMMFADSFLKVQYAVPGATSRAVTTTGVGTVMSSQDAANGPIRPLLGPVRAPKIDGTVDAVNAVTLADPTPTLSWTAPSFGVASSYSVILREAASVNGRTTVTNVATIAVGNATSVRIPPGVMARGHHYIARIYAQTGTAFPQGRSNALTGLMSVVP